MEIAMTKRKYFTVTAAVLVLSGTLGAWAGDQNSSVVAGTTDAQITADVKRAIGNHRELGPPNLIYIDTHNHVVYLSGLVDTRLSREDAMEIARGVPGVRRVVGTIGVEQ
jgi:osmotically-inducible protein OsmY